MANTILRKQMLVEACISIQLSSTERMLLI